MASKKVAKESVSIETKNQKLPGKESLQSKGHQGTMATELPKVSSTAGPPKPQKSSNVPTHQSLKPATTAKGSSKKLSKENLGNAKSSSKASLAVRNESSTSKAKPTVSDKPAGKAPKVKTVAATAGTVQVSSQ